MPDFPSPFEIGHQLWGFLACSLVLATFAMKSMRRLRCVAILSNIAFIYYAGALGLLPIFVLHAVLLPLNVWRLLEIKGDDARSAGASTRQPAPPASPSSGQPRAYGNRYAPEATVVPYSRDRARGATRSA